MSRKIVDLNDLELQKQIQKYTTLLKQNPGQANVQKVLKFLKIEQEKRRKNLASSMTSKTPNTKIQKAPLRRSQRLSKASQKLVREKKVDPKKAKEVLTQNKKKTSKKKIWFRLIFYPAILFLILAVGGFFMYRQHLAHELGTKIAHYIHLKKLPVIYKDVKVDPIYGKITFNQAELDMSKLPEDIQQNGISCSSVTIDIPLSQCLKIVEHSPEATFDHCHLSFKDLRIETMVENTGKDTQRLASMVMRVKKVSNGQLIFKILDTSESQKVEYKYTLEKICASLSDVYVKQVKLK